MHVILRDFSNDLNFIVTTTATAAIAATAFLLFSFFVGQDVACTMALVSQTYIPVTTICSNVSGTPSVQFYFAGILHVLVLRYFRYTRDDIFMSGSRGRQRIFVKLPAYMLLVFGQRTKTHPTDVESIPVLVLHVQVYLGIELKTFKLRESITFTKKGFVELFIRFSQVDIVSLVSLIVILALFSVFA